MSASMISVRKLWKEYGDQIVSKTGPIPTHLTGNMWAQAWGYLFKELQPHKGVAPDMLGEVRPLLGVVGLDRARQELADVGDAERLGQVEDPLIGAQAKAGAVSIGTAAPEGEQVHAGEYRQGRAAARGRGSRRLAAWRVRYIGAGQGSIHQKTKEAGTLASRPLGCWMAYAVSSDRPGRRRCGGSGSAG